MGSKQALSNGNEVEEVTDLLRGFEKLNQIRVKVTLALEPMPKGDVLRVEAVAYNVHVDGVVRARWDYAVAVLPAKEYTTLTGLVTSLLYRLDFEIGEKEMGSTGIKSA